MTPRPLTRRMLRLPLRHRRTTPTDWAEVPSAREAEDQGRQGFPLTHHLLIALLVLVVVLVVGTLLWFYLGRNTGTSAAPGLENLPSLEQLKLLLS